MMRACRHHRNVPNDDELGPASEDTAREQRVDVDAIALEEFVGVCLCYARACPQELRLSLRIAPECPQELLYRLRCRVSVHGGCSVEVTKAHRGLNRLAAG